MLGKVLLGLVVLAATVVGYAALRPSEYSVTRFAAMSAPVEVVFDRVNDPHNWNAWSPWTPEDPEAKYTVEGNAAGIGSRVSWAGNAQAGKGQVTIVESLPNQLIRMTLEFTEPIKDTAEASFSFEPSGDQVVVTWTMSGHRGLLWRVIAIFMDCDSMIGSDFEKALESLKAAVEKPE